MIVRTEKIGGEFFLFCALSASLRAKQRPPKAYRFSPLGAVEVDPALTFGFAPACPKAARCGAQAM